MRDDSFVTKNYTEPGGEVTHIGGQLVFDDGATVEGFPVASASKTGAVKMAANQADSSASSVADLKDDFNALLGKLKTAGIMVPDSTT